MALQTGTHGAMSTRESLRARAFRMLEGSSAIEPGARVVSIGLIVLIGLNMLAVTLQSVGVLYERYGWFLDAFLVFSVAVFATEYILRLWTCTEHPSGRYRNPVVGRLKYAATPLALFDLVAILPFLLPVFPGVDLRLLRIFRLLWLLKVARYLPALTTISHVFQRQRRTLLAALFIMVVTLFVASTLMYLVERDVQPQVFGSIPKSMWWGMTTLTTVGYGDVVPHSSIGRALGMIFMLLGIAIFALPTAILATAFMEEAKRSDFVVTWNLVAAVPLFSELKADEIARIAQLLTPRTAMPNEVIFQRDEPADSMYFVVSGQLEVELVAGPFQLGRGDFFGEIGLLRGRRRSATIIARTYVELLELGANDFEKLLDTNEELKRKIEAIAAKRLEKAVL
jgi:voltage-gated potassium channel